VFLAFLRSFNAVINAVSQNMDQRIAELLNDFFVKPRFPALNPEVNLLMKMARHIANSPRKCLKDL
jgi:hypothetical protein